MCHAPARHRGDELFQPLDDAVPQVAAPRRVHVPVPVMSTGSDQSAMEGVGEIEADSAAAVKRAANAKRKRLQRIRERAKREADIAAAPLPEGCVVSACGAPVSGNTTPSVSVHTLGSTIVQGIVDPRPRRTKNFIALGRKMEGLFGEGLWRTSFKESARCSHRYSLQLLPVDKGPTTRQAPWMEAMANHVQGVLKARGILGHQHQLGAMTLLCSEKGACQQDWHCDFPHKHRAFSPKKLRSDGTVPYPVSVLIAFDPDGAKLPQMRGETIEFGQYDAVVFRGDLEHAGAAWNLKRLNWRIHMYFITGGEKCKRYLRCGVPRGGRVSRGGNHISVCPTRDV